MSEQITVECGQCGAARSPDVLRTVGQPRVPCPSCGSTRLNVKALFTESIGVSASMTGTMTPGEQSNDWQKRWRSLEADLGKVTGGQSATMDRASLVDAERDLLEFLGSCYHLKDILKADEVLPEGVDVEQAINSTPALALLADLANLDKHHVLKKPPRSGHVPKYLGHKGTFTDSEAWRVIVEFDHNGTTINAADVARQATDAWRSFLTVNGLL